MKDVRRLSLCCNPQITVVIHTVTSVFFLSEKGGDSHWFLFGLFRQWEKNYLFICFKHLMNTCNKATLIQCFAHICFSKSDWCCIGKIIILRWGVNDSQVQRDRDMEELLMGDIICVCGSEHLSIYIHRCCAPQWDLMYNACGTYERAINTVSLLVRIVHSAPTITLHC